MLKSFNKNLLQKLNQNYQEKKKKKRKETRNTLMSS